MSSVTRNRLRPKPSSHLVTGMVLRAFAAHSAWLKATEVQHAGALLANRVDERSGRTVEEALGSDNFDFRQEAQAARRTAKRVELLDQLRSKLESQGWQQIGTVNGGEWYQLRFGR